MFSDFENSKNFEISGFYKVYLISISIESEQTLKISGYYNVFCVSKAIGKRRTLYVRRCYFGSWQACVSFGVIKAIGATGPRRQGASTLKTGQCINTGDPKCPPALYPIYVYIYIYVYIEIETEREQHKQNIYKDICVFVKQLFSGNHRLRNQPLFFSKLLFWA